MIEFVIVGIIALLVLAVVMNGSQPDVMKQTIVKQVAKAVKKLEKYNDRERESMLPDVPM